MSNENAYFLAQKVFDIFCAHDISQLIRHLLHRNKAYLFLGRISYVTERMKI